MADWKDIVKAIVPGIATAFGGPAAGMAVKVLGDTLLGNGDATEDQVADAVMNGGLTPDTILKLKEQEQLFQIQMKGIALQEKQADYQNEQAYVMDTQDARRNNAANRDVFHLGIVILVIYALVLCGSLFGSYAIITGGIVLKDVSTVGIVCTFIGGIIGTIGAMAGQIVSFYFGSSKGSEKKTDQLADAFRNLK